MQKGQLSIDLLLAIIAAAILFAVLVNSYNQNFEAELRGQNLKNEAKAILLDVYATIGSAKDYNQSILYTTPKAKERSEFNETAQCTITIDKGQGSITVLIIGAYNDAQWNRYTGLNLGDIILRDPVNSDALMPDPTSVGCGTRFKVERSP